MPPDTVGLYARYGVKLPRLGGGWVSVRCFSGRHKDRRPSAQVNLETGGFVCWACGAKGGVLDALQLLGEWDRDRARELAAESGIELDTRPARRLPGLHRGPVVEASLAQPVVPVVASPPPRPPSETGAGRAGSSASVDWGANAPRARQRSWVYLDRDGKPAGRVVRIDRPDGSKTFRQERATARGFEVGMQGSPLPLYRLPEVLYQAGKGRRVLLVEGEKAVDALERLGVFATTNPGGAGKWRAELTGSLRGARVTVIADCDPPGRRHALRVTQELLGAGVTVTMPLDPAPYAHDGFDVVDHLAGVAETVRAVTPELPPARLRSMLADHLEGMLRHCLPADAGHLAAKLELLEFESRPTGRTLLECERCGRERPHRLEAGLAYCPCGGFRAAP